MDWLVWITQLATLAILGRVLIRLGKAEAEVAKLLEIRMKLASQIKQQRVSVKNPVVDSQGKTNTRDTHDIPMRGGRMSAGVHRVRSDSVVRNTDDDQL